MKLLLSILLLTASAFGAGSITPGSSCGKGDLSHCGWQAIDSNPYKDEGGSKSAYQSGATSLAACNTSLSTSTKYYLTGDVSAANSATQCFNIPNSTQIDLNGFTVTGWIATNGNVSGSSVFNGKVVCDRSGTTQGCVSPVMTSGTMAAQTRVHHLWIVQQDTAASDSLAIAADQSSVTTNNTGQTYSFKYYNLTIDGWSAPTGSRNTALNWIGNAAATAEVYDSVFRSNADQYAPQGVQQSGVASNLYIHNNYFDMATNTTGETARGIAFNSNLIPASTDIARADDNYFIPRNNRAIRIRSRRAQVLRSFIESPAQTATATQGSVHFADQIQAYSEDYSGAIVKDTIVNNQGSGNNVFYIIAGLNARVEGTVKRGSAAGKLANMVVSGANYSITNISTDGTTVSVVTGANGFGDGSYPDSANRHGVIVTISGTTNYNGTYTLASITDSTHFAFLKTGSFATETSGTASADGSTSWYMYNNDAFASPNFNITINGTNNGTTTYCNSGTGSNGGAGSGTAANTNTCP